MAPDSWDLRWDLDRDQPCQTRLCWAAAVVPLLVTLPERLVGGHQQGFALVAVADQLKAGLGLLQQLHQGRGRKKRQ